MHPEEWGKMLELLGIIVLIVVAQFYAQYYIKKSHNSKQLVYLAIGAALYVVSAFLLYRTYYYAHTGIINGVWSVLTIIGVVLVGMFIFHAEVTLIDALGLFLVVLGSYLIFLHGISKRETFEWHL
jgi:multidrug transporter EmrE-like cation transporter